MAKKKKKEEKEESKQNVDEGSRPTLDNIYDDLGGEDLYNDFGDLTQSDINENNKLMAEPIVFPFKQIRKRQDSM